MRVSEIFNSVQGEGPNTGKPAVFLRMALCNLTCEWCDTRYTWDWKHYEYDKEVKEMTIEQVKAEVVKYGVNHLVLTGGEPMLQQNEVLPLLASLKGIGFYIEVETNGTVVPRKEMVEIVDQWNVSPKLENSGNSKAHREKGESYRFFNQLDNSYFKYVISNPQDLNEVQALALRYEITKKKIILMPEARTKEQLQETTKWLQNLSKQMHYSFSTRLHIELWGNLRGV